MTDLQINAMLQALSDFAQDVDQEYGLPIFGEYDDSEKMREIVRDHLNRGWV